MGSFYVRSCVRPRLIFGSSDKGIVFSMVIVRFSMDRTRWDSLKITTHLNFVSGNFSANQSNAPQGTDILDSPVSVDEPPSPTSPVSLMKDREKISVSDHVRSPSDMALGAQRYAESLSLHSLGASMFSSSKSSLPDFYV